MAFVEEFGWLSSPIALTDTTQVGLVHGALIQYAVERYGKGAHYLGVVGETWGGWLNDRNGFALTREDLFAAMDNAAAGPVAEGNVGGGTAMICYDFKGGIGTSSRLVELAGEAFTVGVLVQANHGERSQLRVDGVPVGRELTEKIVPLAFATPPTDAAEGAERPIADQFHHYGDRNRRAAAAAAMQTRRPAWRDGRGAYRFGGAHRQR